MKTAARETSFSQELEQEVKTGLTQAQFEALLTHFEQGSGHRIHQYNYYFDTPDGQLKALGAGLRIRFILEEGGARRVELTLKEKVGPHSKQEFTSHLDWDKALETLKRQAIPLDQTTQRLVAAGIQLADLHCTGQLYNERLETTTAKGIFALDKSLVTDGDKDLLSYELEYEFRADVAEFQDLLATFGIQQVKAPSKLKRAVTVVEHIFSIPEALMV